LTERMSFIGSEPIAICANRTRLITFEEFGAFGT
jgi:hypothetical protein